jgi:hypothetical protein
MMEEVSNRLRGQQAADCVSRVATRLYGRRQISTNSGNACERLSKGGGFSEAVGRYMWLALGAAWIPLPGESLSDESPNAFSKDLEAS